MATQHPVVGGHQARRACAAARVADPVRGHLRRRPGAPRPSTRRRGAWCDARQGWGHHPRGHRRRRPRPDAGASPQPDGKPEAGAPPGRGYPPVTLEDGTPVPVSEAAVVLCDCAVTRVAVDADGVPTDLGRTQRLFTGEQRRAILARDRECLWPSCHMPARWLQIHHRLWWDRDNGADERRERRRGVQLPPPRDPPPRPDHHPHPRRTRRRATRSPGDHPPQRPRPGHLPSSATPPDRLGRRVAGCRPAPADANPRLGACTGRAVAHRLVPRGPSSAHALHCRAPRRADPGHATRIVRRQAGRPPAGRITPRPAGRASVSRRERSDRPTAPTTEQGGSPT